MFHKNYRFSCEIDHKGVEFDPVEFLVVVSSQGKFSPEPSFGTSHLYEFRLTPHSSATRAVLASSMDSTHSRTRGRTSCYVDPLIQDSL